jgi:hypothetical protein
VCVLVGSLKLRKSRSVCSNRHYFALILLEISRPMPSYGPGSVVSIASSYGLDGPGIEFRWGARFSAPVHSGSGPHLASCTMGTRAFTGVKSGHGVTLTPHPLLVPWS